MSEEYRQLAKDTLLQQLELLKEASHGQMYTLEQGQCAISAEIRHVLEDLRSVF